MKVPRKVPRNIYMISKTKKRKKISLRRNYTKLLRLIPSEPEQFIGGHYGH